MKVVILAGGKGIRLGDKYKNIPKPFVKIRKTSIIEKLIIFFNFYGYNEFVICCDNRVNIAKKLINKSLINNNKIKFVNTGQNSNTSLRIFKVKKYIKDENFFLTYGDGISDIDLNQLVTSHKKNKKLITISCYPFTPDKGILKFNQDKNSYKFYEKTIMKDYWVNIGFFIINKKILDKIGSNNISFEETLLKKHITKNKVNFYKHKGMWQYLDTAKDLQKLKKLEKLNLL